MGNDRASGRVSFEVFDASALNYGLSKRTLFYADVGYTRNSPQGTLGVRNTAPVGLPGADQTAVAIGITSKF